MTVFWVVAALLIVASLIFIIPPLLHRTEKNEFTQRRALNLTIYRDQLSELERDLQNDVLSDEQYQHGREDLERRMLEDVADDEPVVTLKTATNRVLVVALAVVVPAAAISLYFTLGSPQAISPETMVASQFSGQAEGMSTAVQNAAAEMSPEEMDDQIKQMVEQLAERLSANPEDGEGWKMLGRSYLVLENFERARDSFEQAARLLPNDAQVLVDLADSLAMTGGQSLEGRAMELINRALNIAPNHEKALWLAGTAAYERKDFSSALGYWQRLRDMMPPGSKGAEAMDSNIAEVSQLLGVPVVQTESSLPAPASSSSGEAYVSGVVSIDAALLKQVDANVTVFIFAQAEQGARMPLAVQRVTAADLPFSFRLDNSMAMTPAMSLAKFPRVVVTARISKSGSASPSSGDFQGRSDVVNTGQEGIQILINEVLP